MKCTFFESPVFDEIILGSAVYITVTKALNYRTFFFKEIQYVCKGRTITVRPFESSKKVLWLCMKNRLLYIEFYAEFKYE